MDSSDELSQIKNLFHVGAYSLLLEAASKLQLTTVESQELLTVFVQRAQLQLKKQPPPSQSTSGSLALSTMSLLARYRAASTADSKAKVGQELTALLSQSQQQGKPLPITFVLAAEILLEQGQTEEAMRWIAPYAGTDVECGSLMVQLLIKLNRLDLAANQLAALKKLSEESASVLLAEAYLHLATGGPSKYQDAFYIFQELLETHGSTPKMLTGQAVCELSMGKYAEAEKMLHESLHANPNDPDTLINLLACSRYQSRTQEQLSKFQAQLMQCAPGHVVLQDLDLKSSLFDRCTQRYAQ